MPSKNIKSRFWATELCPSTHRQCRSGTHIGQGGQPLLRVWNMSSARVKHAGVSAEQTASQLQRTTRAFYTGCPKSHATRSFVPIFLIMVAQLSPTFARKREGPPNSSAKRSRRVPQFLPLSRCRNWANSIYNGIPIRLKNDFKKSGVI